MTPVRAGGDKARGLREMRQARDRGVLVTGEADYQLHWLYLWYEGQPARALKLVRGLDARYPSNPLFLERAALVEHEYFHDHRASAASWQTAIDRAQAGRVRDGRLAQARARLGLAAELIDFFRRSSRGRNQSRDRDAPARTVRVASPRASPQTFDKVGTFVLDIQFF